MANTPPVFLMALLSNKRLLLIAVEGLEFITQSGDIIVSQDGRPIYSPEYGSDGLPDGTDGVLVRSLSINPLQSDTVSRNLIRPYFGASRQLLANVRVQCSFSVELAGSGTPGTPPQYGKALQACGLRETVLANTSVTYAPTSESFGSVTIYYNLDGVLHRVTGCRGTFTLNARVNEIPTIDFTFTGIYNTPEDSALPDVVYTNQVAPLVVNSVNTDSFELLSYSGCLESISLGLNNEIIYRELVGCGKQVLIIDRKAAGTVVLEATTMNDKDYFSAALSGSTLGNLTLRHGTSAGNIVYLESTGVAISNVSYTEQGSIAMLSVPYNAIPSTAGNDEFKLVYT